MEKGCPQMSDKIYISWEDFQNHSKCLAEKIRASKIYFNKIVAVSRGGLLPAGLLSYTLDIRNCETINMSSYDGSQMRSDEEIEMSKTLQDIDSHTLIIDDLSDSGRTFRILRKLYPQAVFVSVYSKEKGKDAVDIFAQEMPDKWIVFPWDE